MKVAARAFIHALLHPSSLIVVGLTISVLWFYRLPEDGLAERSLPQVIFEYYAALPIPLIIWPVAIFHIWRAFDRTRTAPFRLRYSNLVVFALRTSAREVLPRVLALQLLMFFAVLAWAIPISPRHIFSSEWQEVPGDLRQCFAGVVCETPSGPWVWVVMFLINDLIVFTLIWFIMVALEIRGVPIEKIRLVANGALICSGIMGTVQTFLWVGIHWASAWMFNPQRSWSNMGSLFTGSFFATAMCALVLLWIYVEEIRSTVAKQAPYAFRYGLYALALGVCASTTTLSSESFSEAIVAIFRGRGLEYSTSSWSSFVLNLLLFAAPCISIGMKSFSATIAFGRVVATTLIGYCAVAIALLAVARNKLTEGDLEAFLGYAWLFPVFLLQNCLYWLLAELLSKYFDFAVVLAVVLALEFAATGLRASLPYVPLGMASTNLWIERSGLNLGLALMALIGSTLLIFGFNFLRDRTRKNVRY